MNESQKKHFDNMHPGQTLNVSQVRDVPGFIVAAKTYIDQTGLLEFNPNFTQVTKLHPFPSNGDVSFYFEK